MTEFENKLKNAGLRVTEARKALYSVMKKEQVSLSAQELFEKLEKSKKSMKSDLASVYRNLSTFNELGLVHRLTDGRYSLCFHANCSHETHLHLVANCIVCGKTTELAHSDKQLNKKFQQVFKDFESFSKFESITLSGRCSDCLS